MAQAGFKLLTSSDPPTSASQSARITGVSHHAWLTLFLNLKIMIESQEVAKIHMGRLHVPLIQLSPGLTSGMTTASKPGNRQQGDAEAFPILPARHARVCVCVCVCVCMYLR